MEMLKAVTVFIISLVIFAFALKTNPEKSLSELIAGKQELSILNEALNTAGLVDTLEEEGPYTVFAPTNEGFKSLPEGRLDELLQPENETELKSMLKYHVVAGDIKIADLQGEQLFETLEGNKIKVTNGGESEEKEKDMDREQNQENENGDAEPWGSKARVNNASLAEADIEAKNGILHIINAVALPSDIEVMGNN